MGHMCHTTDPNRLGTRSETEISRGEDYICNIGSRELFRGIDILTADNDEDSNSAI
jgi:hypothetical protein